MASTPSGRVPLEAGPKPVYEDAIRLRASESWDFVVAGVVPELSDTRESEGGDAVEVGGRNDDEPSVSGAARVGRLSIRLTNACSSASASRAMLAADKMLC